MTHNWTLQQEPPGPVDLKEARREVAIGGEKTDQLTLNDHVYAISKKIQDKLTLNGHINMQYVKLTTVGATTIESVAASTLSEFEEYLMFSLGLIW